MSRAGRAADMALKGGYAANSTLFTTLIALKLAGDITWPWWWVTAPAWIPVAIAALIILIGLGHFAVSALWHRVTRGA